MGLALPLLVGCATPRAGGGRETDLVRVVIRNDLIPPASVTVRLLGPGGQSLGIVSVSPGSSASRWMRTDSFGGMFRLQAEMTRSSEVRSTPFSLFPGAEVVWELRSNLVRVEQPADG